MIEQVGNALEKIINGSTLEYSEVEKNTLFRLLGNAEREIVDDGARVSFLQAIASMWMPKVSRGDYNTPEYNTREAFCLACRKVANDIWLI